MECSQVIVVDSRTSRADRLHRAVYAWAVDVESRLRDMGVALRGCLLITLTFSGDNRDVAYGAIRRFIDRLKDRYGVRFFFWWAELQRRGMIHYHVLVPNIGWVDERWLDEAWPYGFQSLRWKDGYRGVRYAMSYAKKMKKRFQQDYARFSVLFKNFRAYSSNRLKDWFARSWKYSRWLRERVWELGEVPVRVSGGWYFRSTGETVRSPWVLVYAYELDGGGWDLYFELADGC